MDERPSWPRLSSVVWVVVLVVWPYVLLALCAIGFGIAKLLNSESIS